MSYLTVEVEIRDGKIVAREPEKLPKSAFGLLTITSLKSPADIGVGAPASVIAETWDKLGPAPEIDYDKL
jgi:hypothetical protein